jgi:hypothetical protein
MSWAPSILSRLRFGCTVGGNHNSIIKDSPGRPLVLPATRSTAVRTLVRGQSAGFLDLQRVGIMPEMAAIGNDWSHFLSNLERKERKFLDRRCDAVLLV